MTNMKYFKLLIFWQNYKKAWQTYWQDKTNYWYFFINLFLLACAWLFAYYIFYKLGDDLLIFHYTVDFGIDSISSASSVFVIPILSTLINIINFKFQLFSWRFSLQTSYYRLFSLSSLILNIFIILALLSIYLSNFYA